MEIAQFLTGWADSHVSWPFLGLCLFVWCCAPRSIG